MLSSYFNSVTKLSVETWNEKGLIYGTTSAVPISQSFHGEHMLMYIDIAEFNLGQIAFMALLLLLKSKKIYKMHYALYWSQMNIIHRLEFG